MLGQLCAEATFTCYTPLGPQTVSFTGIVTHAFENRRQRSTEARDANKAQWRERMHGNTAVEACRSVHEVARGIASGRVSTCEIVCGPSGIGKSSTFKNALSDHGRRARSIKSATPLGLLTELEQANNLNEIALLDDANIDWNDLKTLEILKVAFAPSEEGDRIYRHSTNKGNRDYVFNRLVAVIITNDYIITDVKQFTLRARRRIIALTSRVHPIEIRATKSDIFEYVVYLAICHDILHKAGCSLIVANEVLRYFARIRYHAAADISVRGLLMIATKRKNHPQIWKTLLGFNEEDMAPDDDLPFII